MPASSLSLFTGDINSSRVPPVLCPSGIPLLTIYQLWAKLSFVVSSRVCHFKDTCIFSFSPENLFYSSIVLWRFGLKDIFVHISKLVSDAVDLVFLLGHKVWVKDGLKFPHSHLTAIMTSSLGWIGGSADKNTGCLSTGHDFVSHNPQNSSQFSLTPVKGDQIPSCGLHFYLHFWTQYVKWQTQVIGQQQQTLCTEKYYGIHRGSEEMLQVVSPKDNTFYNKRKNKRRDISFSFSIKNRFYLNCFSSILQWKYINNLNKR